VTPHVRLCQPPRVEIRPRSTPGCSACTLSPEQRTAILHTLIPALNRGEIRLAYRGELF